MDESKAKPSGPSPDRTAPSGHFEGQVSVYFPGPGDPSARLVYLLLADKDGGPLWVPFTRAGEPTSSIPLRVGVDANHTPMKQEFGPTPDPPKPVAWIGREGRGIPVYEDPTMEPGELVFGERTAHKGPDRKVWPIDTHERNDGTTIRPYRHDQETPSATSDPHPWVSRKTGARYSVEAAKGCNEYLNWDPRGDVDEFGTVALQCTHEDMSCPPGECADLYPPNREDSGR